MLENMWHSQYELIKKALVKLDKAHELKELMARYT
jgi:hypothetical protein